MEAAAELDYGAPDVSKSCLEEEIRRGPWVGGAMTRTSGSSIPRTRPEVPGKDGKGPRSWPLAFERS